MNTRIECTNRVTDLLLNPYYELIEHTASYGRKISRDKSQKRPLVEFQRLLERIPNWDTPKQEEVFNRYCNGINHDDLTKNLTRTFVSHAKLYSTVQSADPNQRIDLNVPDNTTFFYECLVDVARDCWEKAYLLNKRGSPIEIQHRIQDLKDLIKESIQKTVRRLVPTAIIITAVEEPASGGGKDSGDDSSEGGEDDTDEGEDDTEEGDGDTEDEDKDEDKDEDEESEKVEVDVEVEMHDKDKDSTEQVNSDGEEAADGPIKIEVGLGNDEPDPDKDEEDDLLGGGNVVSEVAKVEDESEDNSGSGDGQIAIEFDAVTPYERKKLSQLAGMATGSAKPENAKKSDPFRDETPTPTPTTTKSDGLFIDLSAPTKLTRPLQNGGKTKIQEDPHDQTEESMSEEPIPRQPEKESSESDDEPEKESESDEPTEQTEQTEQVSEDETVEVRRTKGGKVISEREYQQFLKLKEMYKRKKQQKQMTIVEKLVKAALAKERSVPSRPVRQVKKKKGSSKCLIDM